jgi:hypothetical protein
VVTEDRGAIRDKIYRFAGTTRAWPRAKVATALTQSVAGLTPSVTFNQAFDAMSNRTELKATIGATADFRNSYTYDALQRLTGIVQQSQSGGNSVTAKRVAFSYNNLGQRTQIARFKVLELRTPWQPPTSPTIPPID